MRQRERAYYIGNDYGPILACMCRKLGCESAWWPFSSALFVTTRPIHILVFDTYMPRYICNCLRCSLIALSASWSRSMCKFQQFPFEITRSQGLPLNFTQVHRYVPQLRKVEAHTSVFVQCRHGVDSNIKHSWPVTDLQLQST